MSLEETASENAPFSALLQFNMRENGIRAGKLVSDHFRGEKERLARARDAHSPNSAGV